MAALVNENNSPAAVSSLLCHFCVLLALKLHQDGLVGKHENIFFLKAAKLSSCSPAIK